MKHENALELVPRRSASSVSFRGTWRNELKSRMTLRVKGNTVTGTYFSHVSTQKKAVSGPILGYVNGYTIAFVVTWPMPSITAWVGQMVRKNRRDTIEALWQLTSEVDDPGKAAELWNSVNCGADTFYRVSGGSRAKRKKRHST